VVMGIHPLTLKGAGHRVGVALEVPPN
jgi:hypothetical protein